MSLIKDMTYEQLDTYQFEFVEFKKIINVEDEKLNMEDHKLFKSFKLPDGMTEQDAYKVLSYMYKKASRSLAALGNVRITKEKLVKSVNANLVNFGFVETEEMEQSKKLYVIEDNTDWRTALRYRFEGETWYLYSVTEDEIAEIYAGLGLNLPTFVVESAQKEECSRRIDLR